MERGRGANAMTWREAKWVRAHVVAIACLALVGCAFGDVTIKKPRSADVATGSHRGEGREIVLVRPFSNQRREARCGMKKNGYNTDTASVLCDEAPEVFLANLVAAELAAAGFKVRSDPRQAGRSTIVLTGALGQTFLEPKMDYFTTTFETDIALDLTARTASGLVATRRFFVKGNEATSFASQEDMQRALDSGVRELVMGVVGAVANLADQFPTDDQTKVGP
jgi:hypothetical protein